MSQNFVKYSRYNSVVETLDDGDLLIFNTLSSALAKLNPLLVRYLRLKKNVDLAAISNPQLENTLRDLVKNGILVDAELDEINKVLTLGRLQRYKTSPFGLVIAPTMQCNMACPYCYEKNAILHGPMDEKTQLALVDFFGKNCLLDSSQSSASVTWYGGEPLLAINVIERLSKEFMRLAQKKNIPYEASIVTNGYLLTAETIEKLHAWGIKHAQITIDGMPEVHNQRRKLRSGEDSFDTIIKNVSLAKDYFRVSIRVNVDRNNVEEAVRLKKYLLSIEGWDDPQKLQIYFGRIDDHFSPNPSSECLRAGEFSKLMQTTLKSPSGDKLSHNVSLPKKRLFFCGASGPHAFVVGPNGCLYKCWDDICIPGKEVGDLFKSQELNQENLKWLSLDPAQDCHKCKLLPLCSGGCPSPRVKHGNKRNCFPDALRYKQIVREYYHHKVGDAAEPSTP